jgi:hypothetical protein
VWEIDAIGATTRFSGADFVDVADLSPTVKTRLLKKNVECMCVDFERSVASAVDGN